MSDEGPSDPLTELAKGAAAVHELFTAYTAAGFTRDEALRIVTAMVVAQQKGNE